MRRESSSSWAAAVPPVEDSLIFASSARVSASSCSSRREALFLGLRRGSRRGRGLRLRDRGGAEREDEGSEQCEKREAWDLPPEVKVVGA